MERREFIQACMVMLGSSALAAGCGSGDYANGDAPNVAGDASIPNLSRTRWDDMPSLNFSVSHETFGAIDMSLVEIDDRPFNAETEQFSVVLSGPEIPLFAEGRYDVYNASLGNFELYLQPGESPSGEQRYRAIFSLLV